MSPRRSPRGSASPSSVPELVKRDVTARATELLSRKFMIHPDNQAEARRLGFNYATSVFGEWRGRSYYLCAKYRTSRGDPEADFVVRTTRMTYTALGRFDLAYFRHEPVAAGIFCFDGGRVLRGNRGRGDFLADYIAQLGSS